MDYYGRRILENHADEYRFTRSVYNHLQGLHYNRIIIVIRMVILNLIFDHFKCQQKKNNDDKIMILYDNKMIC